MTASAFGARRHALVVPDSELTERQVASMPRTESEAAKPPMRPDSAGAMRPSAPTASEQRSRAACLRSACVLSHENSLFRFLTSA